MEKSLNILVIEDSAADFLLVERHLRQQGFKANCSRVDCMEGLRNALDSSDWNVVLSDYSVPKLNFIDGFTCINSRTPVLPVILVSGSVGEEQAVELLKMGVWDFVLKDNLTRLAPAIEHSLRESDARNARLAAEESMRESEYRFRSIFNNSPIAIGVGRIDDGRLVEVNDAWLQLSGFERDEVIGRTATELNLYCRGEERNELIRIINERGHIVNREVRIRRKTGDIILVQYSAELVRLGEESFLQVMMSDITEQNFMETELRESEERHRTILQTAMDGFWLMDMQGHILEVNEALCRMSGYLVQELMAISISDLEAAETAADVARHFEKIIEQGEDRFETRIRRKDGSIFDVEVSAQYRPIEGGRIIAFLRDITARKQAEQDLQKKNAEIEQFIYTVSHDLRSPLVTVKTFMGYLEKDMAGDEREQLAQDIKYIHGAADKMKLLLDELLEMSRIGRVETPSVRVSYREVVDEVLDDLAGVIKERTVDIHQTDTDQMLFGDHPRLCQIWQNLIENAIKFCRNDCIPRIELGVQPLNRETVFFVKDNGIGIDPQYHSKIFGIFEKMNPKSPGAGLGLSMIQRIVEKCGGRVWVESEGSGKGACFFFTLPHVVVHNGTTPGGLDG
jgi:PAS domain S-box-containing protein